MTGLRILLTNNTLAARAGTEIVVRDLALALLRRGHRPVAYSTVLGEVAEELERCAVPVVNDLDQLTEPPDLIHGQHHLDAMTAMTRFPDVPAIFVCHGWAPWEELPPVFPSIREYVAVDDLCLERLRITEGIAPERTRVILNAIDVDRFTAREPLPERPGSALVFSNQAHAGNYGGVIERACRDAGIDRVDYAGAASGRPVASPEELLREYDVVFAKGRSAIEAAVSGCAVVVADAQGLSGMVTHDRLPRLRRLNFGLRALMDERVTPNSVAAALADYDCTDAAAVSASMRESASLDQAVDAWERLYVDALGVPVSQDHASALLAASRYLATLAPVIKSRTEAHHNNAASSANEHDMADRLRQAEAVAASLRTELMEAQRSLAASQERWAAVTATTAWKVSTLAWQVKARATRRD